MTETLVLRGRQVAIHVGMPKCGSTFLQKAFFPSHPQVTYLGPDAGNEEFDVLFNYMSQELDTTYDHGEALRLARRAIPETVPLDKLVVISNENIACHSFQPRDIKARRFAELFPEAKIVLVVREPVALVESMYLQYAKKFDHKQPYESLPDWWAHEFPLRGRSGYLSRLQFSETAELYTSYFGRENVCILPFETFAENKQAYFELLCRFLGLSRWDISQSGGDRIVNRRVDNVELFVRQFEEKIPVARTAKWLLPAAIRSSLKKLIARPADLQLTNTIRAQIREFYLQNNPEFGEQWGIRYMDSETHKQLNIRS